MSQIISSAILFVSLVGRIFTSGSLYMTPQNTPWKSKIDLNPDDTPKLLESAVSVACDRISY